MRKLSYAQAINETFRQLMMKNKKVILIGQGVTSPWYVGTTTVGLYDEFGEKRVIDTPISENAITGTSAGAAMVGLRPILVHPRMDFMYYAMDQIANHISNWYFMFGGQLSIPLVMWAIVNRGGEQAAQHSQATHSIFMHLPGIKIVAPSNPYDAKGLLVSAVYDDNPVLFIDDRWLYEIEGEVPEVLYEVPIGEGKIIKEGKDVTLVSTSYMVVECLKASEMLAKENIDVEVIDLRSLKPLDESLLFESVKKTGRLVIADGGWKTGGAATEISALVVENIFENLKSSIRRVSLPDSPAPASCELEKIYYPDVDNIMTTIQNLIKSEKEN